MKINKEGYKIIGITGLICLLLIYVGCSVLPYGYMSYTEIAQLDYPAMLYVFDSMAPGWGGAFISIAIIVGVAGAWLSFTMLPAETTSEMAERHLLPESWGKLNSKGAPQMSLRLVGACIQVFLIVLMFSEDAYNFAFSMCTVSIVITWAFIALYQIKFSAKEDKAAAASQAAKAAIAAVPVATAPKAVAPGSAGELKLHDVEPKTAAMLMAIVADTMGKPLNELRCISIKEGK